MTPPILFITSFLARAATPLSPNEDRARREFILNVLLIAALVLLFVGIVVDVLDRFFIHPATYSQNSLPSAVLFVLLAFFGTLYALSRRQYVALASACLIGAFFFLAAYMGLVWGIDVTASLLFYALTIIMAGILMNTRIAIVVTIVTAFVMVAVGHLQQEGLITVNAYWRMSAWKWTDIVMVIIIFAILASVSWLSNREIEKSLKRARRSERELAKERDMLEVRVEERTNELRQAEMEKISQTYHFIEFGRLASGVFHDLMNPLAALSLNINSIAESSDARTVLSSDVSRAKNAAQHMQELLDSMRRHLSRTGTVELFKPRECLRNIVNVLSTYARMHNVTLSLSANETGVLYGDPVAFTQVITNLIGNAIQSYTSLPNAPVRTVFLELEVKEKNSIVRVRDYGSGIAPDVLPLIFTPFFSTKTSNDGIGIGLSITKRIVENQFNGTITVDSTLGEGSTFTVYFPYREP